MSIEYKGGGEKKTRKRRKEKGRGAGDKEGLGGERRGGIQ